jgi:hypothetical protein
MAGTIIKANNSLDLARHNTGTRHGRGIAFGTGQVSILLNMATH